MCFRSKYLHDGRILKHAIGIKIKVRVANLHALDNVLIIAQKFDGENRRSRCLALLRKDVGEGGSFTHKNTESTTIEYSFYTNINPYQLALNEWEMFKISL